MICQCHSSPRVAVLMERVFFEREWFTVQKQQGACTQNMLVRDRIPPRLRPWYDHRGPPTVPADGTVFSIEPIRRRPFRQDVALRAEIGDRFADRKSTRLNSSHVAISYAVFCLKKKI